MAKKTSKKDVRAKKVARAIRLAWSSLDSHLDYTHGKDYSQHETTRFHQQCTREYSELIQLLTDLY